MNQQEFSARFEAEQPLFDAWGKFVIEKIQSHIIATLPKVRADYFFKIPPSHRIKDTGSLLLKAFSRDKNYTDPYTDITDKVGVRFVVLTELDIKIVCDFITQQTYWTASHDKDYDDEKKNKPYTFAYQSMHYVLRPVTSITVDGLTIDSSVSGEVQIRTILQHAYAELSHPVTYKPKFMLKNKDKCNRLLARSVALIETVDDNFNSVMESFNQSVQHYDTVLEKLVSLYQPLNPSFKLDRQFNDLIIDSLLEIAGMKAMEELDAFVKAKAFVLAKISARIANKDLFFDQPAILFIYFVASKRTFEEVSDAINFEDKYLRSIFSDLGISTDIAN